MKRLVLLVVVALLFVSLGSVVIAPDAEAIPSCMNADNVAALDTGCVLGGLSFTNFVVSPVGVAAQVFLGGLSTVTSTGAYLTFQVSHDPSPANLADILLYYTVQTLNGLPGLSGVELFNAGSNVTIREAVCRSEFKNGVCPAGDVLADYVAPENSIRSSSFPALASTIYVRKDIQLLQDSFISEFTNGHDLSPSPEPTTLLLVGSSLAALGLALRRRRRAGRAAEGAIQT